MLRVPPFDNNTTHTGFNDFRIKRFLENFSMLQEGLIFRIFGVHTKTFAAEKPPGFFWY